MVTKHLGKVFPRSRGDGSIPLSSAKHGKLLLHTGDSSL
jgi:hypothetical protein